MYLSNNSEYLQYKALLFCICIFNENSGNTWIIVLEVLGAVAAVATVVLCYLKVCTIIRVRICYGTIETKPIKI